VAIQPVAGAGYVNDLAAVDEAKEEVGLGGARGMSTISSTTTRAALWWYLRQRLLALDIGFEDSQ
jgi:hypothetical protein